MPSPRKTPKVSRPKTPQGSKRVRGRAISPRLKKLESRIGQRNLAKMLGITPRSLRRYKQGTRKPRKDIRFKIGRIERAAKGIRKTKSIKRKRTRAEKIVREHPEVKYFETRKTFPYADTEHIDLLDIKISDVPDLIHYLKFEGCTMAYFVVHGTDRKTEKVRYYSSELKLIDDFAEEWEEILSGLMMQYEMTVKKIDLIGIMYYAPTTQKG